MYTCCVLLVLLYSVVRQFTDTVGPLPLSVSGRPLQEVLSGSPQLRFVGSKPSSIYLSLTSSVPEKRVVSPTPKRNTKGRIHIHVHVHVHVTVYIVHCIIHVQYISIHVHVHVHVNIHVHVCRAHITCDVIVYTYGPCTCI